MEFEYISIRQDGTQLKAVMMAESVEAVANAIRGSGGKPFKITPRGRGSIVKAQIFGGPKKVTSKELVVFTRQLGAILSAGVLLRDAIETIANDLENKYFADVLKTILFNIHGGSNFSSALALHPKIFSPYFVAIIRSGEEIGRLGKTMNRLATYMEESEKMRLKLLGAIRYPVFLMSFVFLIVSGIVLFLIPKFKAIFEGAGVQLPLLTRIVVGISEFSLHNLPFIAVGFVLLAVLVWKALQNFRIRFMVDYYLLQMPAVGKIIRKALIARFCQTSSMLLEGGVGLMKVLALSKDILNNLFLQQTIEEIRNSVTAGNALSEAMTPHKDLPRILVKMVYVGEKTGNLHDMLRRMGEYYDQEVETFLNNINALLEPILIIVIGFVVTIVALALYLPIFQMSSAVH